MRGFCDLSPLWETRLSGAIVEAYDRALDTAIAEGVDFVVMAGDVFDASRASYGDYRHFFTGLERLDAAGISAYLVPGNHDPFASWRGELGNLPPSARMMGGEAPEYALHERDGEPLCLICARGYRNQSWPPSDSVVQGLGRSRAVEALAPLHPGAARAPFCLGVIHAGLEHDQSKAFVEVGDLLAADVDYWAGGHLHKRHVVAGPNGPRIAYPGCVQARDLLETGERGCFVATLERDGIGDPVRASLEFVPTASVAFASLSVDVSLCQTLADIARLALAALFRENALVSCDEMAVRLVLEGQTDLHRFLVRPDVLADLRKRVNNSYPTFFCDALVDRTRPPRDRGALSREGLMAAHVLRVAGRQRAHADEMVNYVQAEFVKRGIDVPSELASRMDVLNDAAETLVLDLLEEEPS